jgi:hypothetical protein
LGSGSRYRIFSPDAMAIAKTWCSHLKEPRLRRVSAPTHSEGLVFRKTMTMMVQVEFRESLLSVGDEILQSLGHPVISALGSRAARNPDVSHERSAGLRDVGAGMQFRSLASHGTPWRHNKSPHRCDTRKQCRSGDHKTGRHRVF